MFNSSASGTTSHQHHRHEASDPIEESAEANETIGRDGVLSPRLTGLGPIRGFAVNDPVATDAIRIEANIEDDGATEMMIEHERKNAEHGE